VWVHGVRAKEGWSIYSSGPLLGLYSPNLREGKFSEVRMKEEGPYAATATVYFSKRCTKGSAYHSTRNAPATKAVATAAVAFP
jgi:hypothetical protein